MRSVGPVVAYGKAPVPSGGLAAGGKIDATNITPDIAGQTLQFGNVVTFQYQVNGVPALTPGYTAINFTGASPVDTIGPAIEALGLGIIVQAEDNFILDLSAPTVGSQYNYTLTSSTALITVQGMSGGVDASAGSLFPYFGRAHR